MGCSQMTGSRLAVIGLAMLLYPGSAMAAPVFDDNPINFTPVTNFGSAFDKIVSQTDPTKTKLDNGYTISDLFYSDQKLSRPDINVSLRWTSFRSFSLAAPERLTFTLTGDTNATFGTGSAVFQVIATLDGGNANTMFSTTVEPLGRSLTWDVSGALDVPAGNHRLGMFSQIFPWSSALPPDILDVSSTYTVTVAAAEPASWSIWR
jgi:hypothetical protein